ncbi:ArpU family phage transcriptional regulator [Bacillus cereus VD115]|nr:ArpU family phage transcriptional regulator [Bacillus cereus VD115]
MKVLKNQLREWKKQSNQSKMKNKKKRKEKLSTREFQDLMGMHRPCYERRRGALRQKNKKEWSYMNKQLSFLPKIDRSATQEKLEGVLESVRIYRQFGMIRNEMKVTPSYEMREHGPTYTVGKLLEDVAIANLQQSEREEWLELISFRIDQFLNRLGNGSAGRIQRDIISKRYLEEEDVCDYMIYNEIGMVERTYRRWKSRAFYNLAFALRLEVYENEETGGNE